MDKRIGFITEENCSSNFDDLKGYFVNRDNPNYPEIPTALTIRGQKGELAGFKIQS